jgi:hypothetical protein
MYREIDQEAHMSSRDISSTIKKAMETDSNTNADFQQDPDIEDRKLPGGTMISIDVLIKEPTKDYV